MCVSIRAICQSTTVGKRLRIWPLCPPVWRSEDGAAGAAGTVWQQSEGESRAGGGAAALQGRAGEAVRGGSGEGQTWITQYSSI